MRISISLDNAGSTEFACRPQFLFQSGWSWGRGIPQLQQDVCAWVDDVEDCAAGVGRFRPGSRADRSLSCTNARPRKIPNSVESRAVSVNASTKKGESSDEVSRPGNSRLVEQLAGDELEVGSEDGSVSETGAETSEFHVDRSRIPGWSPRALLLFSFLFGPCRCPMIMGGYISSL